MRILRRRAWGRIMLDLDDEGQLIKGRHKVDLTPANLIPPSSGFVFKGHGAGVRKQTYTLK